MIMGLSEWSDGVILMRNVQFISRKEALFSHFNPQRDALISISDSEDERQEMINSHPGIEICSFVFHDIDEKYLIDNRDTKRMVQFIDDCKPYRNLYVHCLMGASRSAAVAKFVNEYIELDNEYLNRLNLYNSALFNRLMSYVGMSMSSFYEELERQDRQSAMGKHQ